MLTRQMGDPRVGDGVDHLGAVLDDAALLVVLAHHVARGVLEEQQGHVGLVAELDELGGLVGLLAEEHAAVVGEDTDGVAVDGRPAGHEARPVQRLELVEARPVDHPRQHVAGVEGDPQVGRRDARAARRGRSTGLVRRHRRRRGRACASSAGRRWRARCGWRRSRRRRGSRPGRSPGRAWTRPRAPRRRTPRPWPSSPAAVPPGTPWSGPRSSRCGRSCPARRRRRRWSSRTRARWWGRPRPSAG